MAFLSGLWLPLEMLPQLFATLAPTWPPYHLAQLALRVVGMDGGGSMVVHVAMPVAVTVVFFALARRRLQRVGQGAVALGAPGAPVPGARAADAGGRAARAFS